MLSEDEFKKTLKSLPDFDVYKRDLDDIKSLVHESMSQQQIKEIYYSKAQFLTHPIAEATPEALNNQVIYRVRMNIPEQQNLNLIRTYSYPDPSFCGSNGRANIKGTTTFYCSNNF